MTDNYQSGDRRPIASRQWKLSHRLTHWLVARRVSANAVSMTGMAAGLLAGGCLAATAYLPGLESPLWFAGAMLVQGRLLANMLDGMVAIESKSASPVGELFNEVPDRISDTAILIGLGLAADSNALLGLGAALAAMLTAYVRAVGKAAGAHQEFCGPMAKPQRMFLVTLLALFCALAPREWRSLGGVALPSALLVAIIAGSCWTALRRLFRVAHALHTKKS